MDKLSIVPTEMRMLLLRWEGQNDEGQWRVFSVRIDTSLPSVTLRHPNTNIIYPFIRSPYTPLHFYTENCL
jgi:hypothetical protein